MYSFTTIKGFSGNRLKHRLYRWIKTHMFGYFIESLATIYSIQFHISDLISAFSTIPKVVLLSLALDYFSWYILLKKLIFAAIWTHMIWNGMQKPLQYCTTGAAKLSLIERIYYLMFGKNISVLVTFLSGIFDSLKIIWFCRLTLRLWLL